MAKKKLDLNTLELPDDKKRRGSYIVRLALARVTLHQHRDALKASSRMVMALPVIQVALLVGVLNGEFWLLLLGLEGGLIAWLAASQISRPTPESKVIGFGIALLNTVLLSVTGIFLGSQVFWVTGLLGIVPVIYLLFSNTGRHTLKLAWLLYIGPLLILTAFAAAGRVALQKSESEQDPAKRGTELQVAWCAMLLRGGNGTERALMRLRQAQTAFAAGEYEAAYEFADDGIYTGDRRLRAIPASLIGTDLLDSLMRVKAQSFYNHRWGKDGQIYMPIKPEPLDEESLTDPTTSVRWGW
ncbi:MAG: hypothetical protein KDB90_00140 [Planctomycetes bacterium]|nr:hypothetical protein [Planctomycetota bacterium]